MKKMEIELKKEVRAVLVERLKKYYWTDRDEEITDLGAELMLDFIINEIGAYIYNQGIEDCYAYMNERNEDMLGLQKRLR